MELLGASCRSEGNSHRDARPLPKRQTGRGGGRPGRRRLSPGLKGKPARTGGEISAGLATSAGEGGRQARFPPYGGGEDARPEALGAEGDKGARAVEVRTLRDDDGP